MTVALHEEARKHIMISAIFSLRKSQNCVLCELLAEAEETVEHRAWWIENFGVPPLKDADFTARFLCLRYFDDGPF